MGDANQYRWVESHRSRLLGPTLEIGSRQYARASSSDFRTLCQGHDYVGVDMSAGDNVDRVVNFTDDFHIVDEQLDGRRFNTVLCLSVMEHVSDIFSFARNLTSITAQGGMLFVSVPFTWRFHGYPSDYWRFSPEGVKHLFPQFEFDAAAGMLSSNVMGDTAPLSQDVNDFAVETPARNIFNRILVGKRPYLLKPTMISMLGMRRP